MLKLEVYRRGAIMEEMKKVIVIKKDGTEASFDPEKIKKAVKKSAARVLIEFTDEDLNMIVSDVEEVPIISAVAA